MGRSAVESRATGRREASRLAAARARCSAERCGGVSDGEACCSATGAGAGAAVDAVTGAGPASCVPPEPRAKSTTAPAIRASPPPRARATGNTRDDAGTRSPAGSADRSVVPGITGTTSTPRSARGFASANTLEDYDLQRPIPPCADGLRSFRARQRRLERLLELGQGERLHEIGGRLERQCLVLGRKDAGEDDGEPQRAETARVRKAVAFARLDHRRIDVQPRLAELGEDGLVPRTPDDVREERTDVGVRLDDQDPGHRHILPGG